MSHQRRDNTDQFFQPPNTGGGNNDYSENQVYQVNTILPVSWATKYVSYQFELWQQAIGGNSATKGPTIYCEHSLPLLQHYADITLLQPPITIQLVSPMCRPSIGPSKPTLSTSRPPPSSSYGPTLATTTSSLPTTSTLQNNPSRPLPPPVYPELLLR